MVATFMILIMTRPIVGARGTHPNPARVRHADRSWHGPRSDGGEWHYPISRQLRPCSCFAALYFAVMIDAGLFDPLVSRVRRIAGDDPVRVAIGTAIVALIVSLDGGWRDDRARHDFRISTSLPANGHEILSCSRRSSGPPIR